jgi:hypothetical protein
MVGGVMAEAYDEKGLNDENATETCHEY